MVKRLGAAACLLLAAATARADELSEAMFFADLPDVLTASRLAQPLADAPSAITVIDRGLIEASGFREIPDLLRLVPGFYVGYVTGNQPIAANALIHDYTRHMQVLVDGRSVYLPTIGGVSWSALPLSIDDIERIEVTRGPNSASHGANAFTGVINIITRHPDDQEAHGIRLLAGTEGARVGTLRWVGGTQARHRVTLEYREDDGFAGRHDHLRAPMLHYRGDLELNAHDGIALQLGYIGGDRGAGAEGNALEPPHRLDMRSHFQQLDWFRRLAEGGELRLKLYHNLTETREDIQPVPPFPRYDRDILAQRWHLEMQHTLAPGDAWRAVWGAALRQDNVRSQLYFSRPDKLRNHVHSLFGHVEARLAPDWLVNAGAMLEHHDIGGGSVSPRVSLHWQPLDHHAWRASLSSARRYPVQFEENALSLPWYRARGGLEPETIVARELGYVGAWPQAGVSVDARVFHWRLGELIDRWGPRPWDIRNQYAATLRGFDMQLRWRPSSRVDLLLNYANTDVEADNSTYRNSSPEEQVGLLLTQRFADGWSAHLGAYYTAGFHPMGTGSRLPATRRVDLKLARALRVSDVRGDLALVLQNVTGEYLDFDNNNRHPRRAHVQLRLDF